MLNLEEVKDLSSKLRELLKKSPADDLDKNLHALLQSAFTKMGLVSREEFDVQTQVLQNTQAKLKGLEQQISALESNVKQ